MPVANKEKAIVRADLDLDMYFEATNARICSIPFHLKKAKKHTTNPIPIEYDFEDYSLTLGE